MVAHALLTSRASLDQLAFMVGVKGQELVIFLVDQKDLSPFTIELLHKVSFSLLNESLERNQRVSLFLE